MTTNDATGPVVYVVATPIGNLDDLTPRARKTLAGVDLIAAEDTRHARKLLSHLGIQGKRLVSYQDHGEQERAESLVRQLQDEGLSLALVSDAGTPCVSDPGYRLVAAAKAAGIRVHPIPGPSALTTLVSASGLPSDRLLFVGFLPNRAERQRAEIESWAGVRASVVFFEATRRLARTLGVIRDVYPEARVAVGRELTKLYEEIVTVPIDEALSWSLGHATMKGEASVMVDLGSLQAGRRTGGGLAVGEAEAPLDADGLVRLAADDFLQGASLKDLLRKYRDAGFRRADLYNLLLDAKNRAQ